MADLIPTSFSTGAVSIQRAIQAHDFGKGPLTCVLAPSFGCLNKDDVLELGDAVKVMLVGSLKALSRVPVADKSWESAMGALTRDVPVVQRYGDLCEREYLIGHWSLDYFKPSGARAVAAVANEVKSWLQGLLGERNLDNIEMFPDILANMILEVGATLGDKEKGSKYGWAFGHNQTLLDVGVMQFPDWKHPYQIDLFRLKLFRLKLIALWPAGIVGECTLREFGPDPLAFENMSPADRQNAIDMADSIFDYTF